jgi:hypothetical protein
MVRLYSSQGRELVMLNWERYVRSRVGWVKLGYVPELPVIDTCKGVPSK